MSLAPVTRRPELGLLVAAFGLWLAVAVLCCALIVGVGNRSIQRAHAQSSADAAALAGAAAGRDQAAAIARSNNANLLSFVQSGSTVTVRVEFEGVHALASAERQIRPGP